MQGELFPTDQPSDAEALQPLPENLGTTAPADPYADNERRAAERAATADAGNAQTGAEQTGFYPDIVANATGTTEPPRRQTRPSRRPVSKRAGLSREEARAEDHTAETLANGLTGPIPLRTAEEEQVRVEGFAGVRKELGKIATRH